MTLTSRYYVYCDGAEDPEGWPRCRWLTFSLEDGYGCLKGHEITNNPEDFGDVKYEGDGEYVCDCKDYADGEAKGVFCFLDNEPCLPDEEGFGRCGDLLKTCLWAEKEKRRELPR